MNIPKRNGNFLPYIEIELGYKDNIIKLDALKDSGASHCLLDIQEFKTLKGHKNMSIKAKNLKMITPNGTTENAVQGEVIMDIYMTDITGNIFMTTHPFLLTNIGKTQKCILGYDFLSREDIIIGVTPKHLFLKKKGDNHAIEIKKGNHNTQGSNPTVINPTDIAIQANTTKLIELMCESDFTEITDLDNRECIFQPNKIGSTHQDTYGLILTPALTIPRKTTENAITLTALISNTNNEDVILKAKTELGNLEDISYNNTTTPMQENYFNTSINHIN